MLDVRRRGLSGVFDLLEVLGHPAQLLVSAAGCRDRIAQRKDDLAGRICINAGRDQQFVGLDKARRVEGGPGRVLLDLLQCVFRSGCAAKHVGQCRLILLQLGVIADARLNDFFACRQQSVADGLIGFCGQRARRHRGSKVVAGRFCLVRKFAQTVFRVGQAAF